MGSVQERGLRVFVIILGALLVVGLVPTASTTVHREIILTGGHAPSLGECVVIHTDPPDVEIGPCVPTTTGSTFGSQAKGQDLDVHVAWDVEASDITIGDVDHIQVLRGTHPGSMSPIAGSLSPSSTSFLDTDALITAPGEVWYQVQTVLDDGTVIEDDPVHVRGYGASST